MSRLRACLVSLSLLLVGPACQKDPATPEYWSSRLEDTSRTQDRVRVVEALRTSGRLTPAFLPMLHAELGRERRPEVKAALARVLGQLKDATSVQPLAAALDLGNTEGAGNAMNKEVVHALATIGDRSAGPTLLQAMHSRDPYVRVAAIDAMGALRLKEAAGPLEALASDPSTEPYVVKKAIQALGHIAAPSSVPVLLRMMFKERPGISFYVESSFALYQVGTPATEALMAALEGRDAELLKWAGENNIKEAGILAKCAQVLGDLHVRRAAPVLLRRLGYDSPDAASRLFVRMLAAEALGRMRAASAAQAISGLLGETEPDARQRYVKALVRLGGREGIAALTRSAEVGRWAARESSLAGLVLLADSREVPVLARLAQEEPARTAAECRDIPEVRGCKDAGALGRTRQAAIETFRTALEAAAELKTPAAWAQALQHADARVRERAAYELGRLGDATHVALLAARTREKDLDARVAVFQALDWLSDTGGEAEKKARSALPQLEKQLLEEHGMTQFVVVNEDLRRLVAKLKRRSA
ncbi:MAG: HEAT repeat domain-containing protein [Myxococcaceae bacterium]|nr:HEAT repeat domain-containing protein [Myxococcaceae bacterium]MCI0673480.1 HEAT repeat domain-containing protein [Myxococcaceae bacterium]